MEPSAPVDGIATRQHETGKGGVELRILLILLLPYLIYAGWCLLLLSILPNPDGNFRTMIPIGRLSALIVSLLSIGLGLLLARRALAATHLPERTRVYAVVKIAFFILPALILSGFVAVVISREPRLPLEVVDPAHQRGLVAPLAVTFSLEEATRILRNHGKTAVVYGWDFDGDGKRDEETVEPRATAYYEKQGSYAVVARIELRDKSFRRVKHTLSIPSAVFSVSPRQPIVDEPIRFSVEHLQSEENKVREARWDFDGDGEFDEVTKSPSIVHTFVSVGEETIAAEVLFQNQAQMKMKRAITVSEPKPPPFPVAIRTQPEMLLGPPPFGVLFSIETEEPHREVVWDFGDGERAAGDRVGHTYAQTDSYRATAQVRSIDGPTAILSKVVRVTEILRLSDLEYTGAPDVQNRSLAAGVPVTVNLTPRTSLPLVEFFWEAPGATVVESTKGTLRATYRRPGGYIITLIASDPSSSVRIPLKLTVSPPSSIVSIHMKPNGGTAPLPVEFDASETYIPGEIISGFEWTFSDDENLVPQQGARVSRVFEQPGTYTVHLKTITQSGKFFEAEQTIVVRPPVLDACFEASRYRGNAPMGVSFTMSCSTGTPTEIRWDFGDGAQTDERDPVHVFERQGVYTVTLQLKDAAGTVSSDQQTITALGP